jgi:hypothetical protein
MSDACSVLNVATNRLFAMQQYVSKLEKRILQLVTYAIIMTCTAASLFAYIVWTVK